MNRESVNANSRTLSPAMALETPATMRAETASEMRQIVAADFLVSLATIRSLAIRPAAFRLPGKRYRRPESTTDRRALRPTALRPHRDPSCPRIPRRDAQTGGCAPPSLP